MWDQSGYCTRSNGTKETRCSYCGLYSDYVWWGDWFCTGECFSGKRVYECTDADCKRSWNNDFHCWSCDQGGQCGRSESAGTYGWHSALFWGGQTCFLSDLACGEKSIWFYQWNWRFWNAGNWSWRSFQPFGVSFRGTPWERVRVCCGMFYGGDTPDPCGNSGIGLWE